MAFSAAAASVARADTHHGSAVYITCRAAVCTQIVIIGVTARRSVPIGGVQCRFVGIVGARAADTGQAVSVCVACKSTGLAVIKGRLITAGADFIIRAIGLTYIWRVPAAGGAVNNCSGSIDNMAARRAVIADSAVTDCEGVAGHMALSAAAAPVARADKHHIKAVCIARRAASRAQVIVIGVAAVG